MRRLVEKPAEVIEILDSDEESELVAEDLKRSEYEVRIKKSILSKNFDDFKFYFFASLTHDDSPNRRDEALRDKYIEYFR
jgi:hypothetical protein